MAARPLGLGAFALILVLSGFMNALQAPGPGPAPIQMGKPQAARRY